MAASREDLGEGEFEDGGEEQGFAMGEFGGEVIDLVEDEEQNAEEEPSAAPLS